MAQQTYEVHLTEAEFADSDVESPVATDRIDFYDSGVWVDRPGGRTFFPYVRILRIEQAASGEAEAGAEPATGEPEPPEETEHEETGHEETGHEETEE